MASSKPKAPPKGYVDIAEDLLASIERKEQARDRPKPSGTKPKSPSGGRGSKSK